MHKSSELPRTLGALKASGWRSRSVKEELRENLRRKLESGESWLKGIVGFEETVLPQLEHAILSQHDFVLLGLRGQAKTRIIRQTGPAWAADLTAEDIDVAVLVPA